MTSYKLYLITKKLNIQIYNNIIDNLIKSSVECQEGEFASHPGDCNKYLQCLWGKFKANSCPAGLYWNNVRYIFYNDSSYTV